MVTQHHKGEIVTVFTDPITQSDIEGRARLESLDSRTPDGEYWHVRFRTQSKSGYEDQVVIRLIAN